MLIPSGFVNCNSCHFTLCRFAMTATKKSRPARPLLEPVSDDGNSSFARALGSVDYSTREQGLQALTVFLSTRRELARHDMRKLWKGLFYCFWHSDKEPVQVGLAQFATHCAFAECVFQNVWSLKRDCHIYRWVLLLSTRQMSEDHRLPQEELASRLAGILSHLSPEVRL